MRFIKILRYLIPVALVVAGIVYYCFFDSLGQLFPKCPVKLLTGLSCPSCGAQRAFSALLKGNFLEALSYNWFIIFFALYAVSAVVAVVYNFNDKLDKFKHFIFSRKVLLTYVALYIIWFVVRNIWELFPIFERI